METQELRRRKYSRQIRQNRLKHLNCQKQLKYRKRLLILLKPMLQEVKCHKQLPKSKKPLLLKKAREKLLNRKREAHVKVVMKNGKSNQMEGMMANLKTLLGNPKTHRRNRRRQSPNSNNK